jgi:hypothetical protein
LSISPAGVLDLGSYYATVAHLSGSGMVTQSGAGSGLVVAPSDGTSTTFSGAINDGGRTGSDAVQLLLSGSGSGGGLALSGSNSYSNGTVVSGGTLDFLVPQSLPGTGIMTVSDGGWVVLGDPSGAAGLIGLLSAHSPLVEAVAPNLASAGISGDAGLTPSVTSGSIPYPLCPIPSASYMATAGAAGSAAAVPEPGTLALLVAAALCGLGVWLRKRAK